MSCVNTEQNSWLANVFNKGVQAREKSNVTPSRVCASLSAGDGIGQIWSSSLPFIIFLEISPNRDLFRLSCCYLFKCKQVLLPKGQKRILTPVKEE